MWGAVAGGFGIAAVIIILTISLLVTRLATIALTMTGMTEEAARFQARSAFTGVGYTTQEAEEMVNHPVRRRIIMWLMILRSTGFIALLASMVLSFSGASGAGSLVRLAVLIIACSVLYLLARSKWANEGISAVMKYGLQRWTSLDVRDYVSMLKLTDSYEVRETTLCEGHWLAGKHISDSELPEQGVLVLGVYHEDGSYEGVPESDSELHEGDRLVIYGSGDALSRLQLKPEEDECPTDEPDLTGEEAADRDEQKDGDEGGPSTEEAQEEAEEDSGQATDEEPEEENEEEEEE
jgi:hypothetical protein